MSDEEFAETGYRKLGGGMIVCDQCGAVHSLDDGAPVPPACDQCGGGFTQGRESTSTQEMVHYEIDCPKCGTHFSCDEPPGPVIFDCDHCGCAFTVSDESARDVPVTDSPVQSAGPEPSRAPAGETFTEAMNSHQGRQKTVHRAAPSRRRSESFLKSRAGGLGLTLVCIGLVGFFIWDAMESHRKDKEAADAARDARTSDAPVDDLPVDADEKFEVQSVSNSDVQVFASAIVGLLNAPLGDDQLEYCRHPGVTRPRMDAFREHSRVPTVIGDHINFSSPVVAVTTPFGQTFMSAVLEVSADDHRHVVVELTPDRELLFEWELLTNYSQFNWSQLKVNRPRRPFESLVKIERSTRYPREFPPSEFVSYRVFQGDGLEGFPVFVERAGDLHHQIEEIFDTPQFPLTEESGSRMTRRIIAELQFPNEQNPSLNRLQLRRVVQNDWVALGE